MAERPHLALLALRVHGREELFDKRLPAHHGVHLRWSFLPELGFPPGGFDLFRGGRWSDPDIPVGHAELPRDRATALSQIADLTPEVRRIYERGADELIAFLDESPDRAVGAYLQGTSADGGPGVARLRAIDMILAASLDPFFARMAGLYRVDGSAPPPIRNDPGALVGEDGGIGGVDDDAQLFYKVVGHWGSRQWPWSEADFGEVAPAELVDGELEKDGVALLASARSLVAVSRAEDDLEGPYLRTHCEDAWVPLRLIFPGVVAEAAVRVGGVGEDAGWGATVDSEPAEVVVGANEDPLMPGERVTVRGGADGFRQLDLRCAKTSWYFYGAGYRLGHGEIGDLTAHALVTDPQPGVSALALEGLEANAVPARLDRAGNVSADNSEVELFVGSPDPPADSHGRPVRMHVRRSPGGLLTGFDEEIGPPVYRSPEPLSAPAGLLAEWRLDGDADDARSQTATELRGSASFAQHHPHSIGRRSLSLRGGGFLAAEGRPELESLGGAATLDAWILPRAGDGNATIAGNGRERGIWLGLLQGDERHRPVAARLNGQGVRSSERIAVGRWVRVSVVYDGATATLYLDGEQDSEHEVESGPLRATPGAGFLIGAMSDSTTGSPRFAFSGLIADLRVWNRALHPVEADELTDAAQPPPPLPGARAQFADQGLADGEYDYEILGIDLFGRIAEWSEPGRIRVADDTPPAPPSGVRARFLPPDDTVGHDSRLEVSWGLNGRQRLFGRELSEFRLYRHAGALNSRSGVVRTVRPGAGGACSIDTDATLPGPPNALVGGACQVGFHRYALLGHDAGGDATLELTYEAMPPIVPRVGDAVSIPIPADAPMHADPARPAAWGTPEAVVAPRLEDAVEAPAGVSIRPCTTNEIAVLRDGGATWLPAEGVYLALVPPPVPAGAVEEDVADFVPGAFVGRDEAAGEDEGAWRVLTVLWHAAAAGGAVELYVVSDDGEPLPARMASGRYLPGQRYRTEIELGERALFSGGPTAQHEVGVSAVAARGAESGITGPASAVAVDRRPPPPPPIPVIDRIDRAGYDGRSAISVSWEPAASVRPISYKLYRATDGDVFARDLEQRRLLTGPYPTPLEAVREDDDFSDWLAVIAVRLGRPGLEANWKAELFPPRPSGARPTDTMPADPAKREAARRAWQPWDDATPVWRAWAERFYPAREDGELQEIAGREGNEVAFMLVHAQPLRDTGHADLVPGLVRNRYLYRLRTQSPALIDSAEWGPVSEPKSPPLAKAPRAPVLSGADPGDRSVALRWSPNREPELAMYQLYSVRLPPPPPVLTPARRDDAERAEVDYQAALEAAERAISDLRWWPGELPYRRAGIPDRRPHVRAGELKVPGGAALAEITGVFRAAEYVGTERDGGSPEALDWRTPATESFASGSDLVVRGLRRAREGEAMTVTGHDAAGDPVIFGAPGEQVLHLDDGLPGRAEHLYRLVAVDDSGARSEGSAILRARALEIAPPAAPVVTVTRLPSTEEADLVKLACETGGPEMELMVQARRVFEAAWRTIHGWQAVGVRATIADEVPAGDSFEYRVWSRTPSGSACLAPAIHTVPSRDAEPG